MEIKFENIWDDAQDQFENYRASEMDVFGEDYDYGSVMHYGPKGPPINYVTIKSLRHHKAEYSKRRILERISQAILGVWGHVCAKAAFEDRTLPYWSTQVVWLL